MIIKTIPVGDIQENCYIVMDEKTKEAFVVDPGDQGDYLADIINKLGAKLKFILLTHGHFDHVGAVSELKSTFKVPHFINEDEKVYMQGSSYVFGKIPEAERYLKDGEEIDFSGHKIKCIHTPGHSAGGMCFLLDGEHLFAGDTLFYLSVGRSDFEGGDMDTLVDSIRTKLFILNDNTIVYPGHGPKTSIMTEKRGNPFAR
ncbi:MBL fold metallo-hydrolase [Clostridium sp. 'White wine YQ']|uniref:MBL fold metallo-hydrolase n=1 Tax=Clostridium sp. 'White wine YQ' TaxID=3027474 RepID=UPI002366D274|nr:MBL fold metallo-hydrolase [Clostridium sp. 'White wine YQ']MDD7794044.1 MBL fold metallo-hydrolase [Clostridium sp. 'White wine YQ']